jgi:hypothetical protein
MMWKNGGIRWGGRDPVSTGGGDVFVAFPPMRTKGWVFPHRVVHIFTKYRGNVDRTVNYS